MTALPSAATADDYARLLVLAGLALAARPAAAEGAPLTLGVSLVRRGMARPSETPAGVALSHLYAGGTAPAGLVVGGARDLITSTVSPKPQNGRGSHAELI